MVIAFDSAKYLFNAGENVGRVWLQGRQHWRKTKGIFLTSVGTQRCSGLPGPWSRKLGTTHRIADITN